MLNKPILEEVITLGFLAVYYPTLYTYIGASHLSNSIKRIFDSPPRNFSKGPKRKT